MTNIIISNGIVPVHSFDLWGPIVDATKLGRKALEDYIDIAKVTSIPVEEAAKAAKEYKMLIDGHPDATGARKGEIIDAVENVLKANGISKDFGVALQEDGLYVLREILDAGEKAIIFSSKPWDKYHLPEDIADRMGDVYDGGKTNPAEFVRVYNTEKGLGRMVVTHTADELPELIAATKTELFKSQGLIYVDRNQSNTREQVLTAGIGQFVTDLKQVDYANLVTTQ
ncbi:hypothetical protein HQ533_05020 [Candidatus Woesearchaeota archaeon]|nr:hypothetical protein [Candidatus Woesearchaeota archaeon]